MKALTMLVALLCANAASASILRDGTFKTTTETNFVPEMMIRNGQLEQNLGNTYFLSKDELVEIEFQNNGEILLTTYAQDADKEEFLPNKVIVSAAQFEKMNLIPINTDISARRRTHYRSGGRLRWGTYGGCVAYVARAIGFSGIAGNGVGMTNALAGRGWRSVSCTNPPMNAVASWSGGSGAGHTAIWNGSCWAYDRGCTGLKMTGYRLRNCVAR